LIVALGYALTGERLPDSSAAGEPVLDQLSAAGWPTQRILDFRAERSLAGARWPLPVDRDLLGGVGLAQFQAALNQLVAALDESVARVRHPGPLDREDLRLLAEVPPHSVNPD
jgi:hypothetical protein